VSARDARRENKGWWCGHSGFLHTHNTLLQDGKIPAKFDKEGNAIGFGQKREVREFNGKKFLMETALTGDVAIIRAHKADEAGNCIFRYTSAPPRKTFKF
jgi:acyl CoA:acetate/3-ketoacid CoA transferase alpha subunit